MSGHPARTLGREGTLGVSCYPATLTDCRSLLLCRHIGGKLGLINDVARRTGVHMSLPGLQRQGSANF